LGADKQAIEDLLWLGLHWDNEEIHAGDQKNNRPSFLQSERQSRFDNVLQQLRNQNLVYPCNCSRSDVERASSAPHESLLDGMVYPGTCSVNPAEQQAEMARSRHVAWRFRLAQGEMSFDDKIFGVQKLDASHALGDFIVARTYGGAAYQLAVVVDDHDTGVNWVVRGSDLIYSTYRQIALHEALGWQSPQWLHVPLVVGPDGLRLAKRHGDTRLSFYREKGVEPTRIIAILAKSLGFCVPDRITPGDLLQIAKDFPHWIGSISQEPFVVRSASLE